MQPFYSEIETIDYHTNPKFRNVSKGARDILNLLKTKQIVSCTALEKCGKRSLVQASAQADRVRGDNSCDHYLISGLNRKDWYPQIEEFEKGYGVSCIIVNSAKQSQKEAKEKFRQILASKRRKIIHCDESDWATSMGGPLGLLFEEIIKNPNNRIALYSATNEELNFALDEYFSKYKHGVAKYTYDPGPTFRGPGWYLQNDRARESEAFISSTKGGVKLTDHGCEVIKEDLIDRDVRFGIVRLAIKGQFTAAKNSDEFKRALKRMGVTPLFFDQYEGFDWFFEHKGKRGSWSSYVDGKYLIFINQICSRSTEVGFLPEIGFWHDYRVITPSKTHNTLRQAIGRVYHFTGQYNTQQKLKAFGKKTPNVRLYCHLPVLEAAANNTITPEIKASSRVASEKKRIIDFLWVSISDPIVNFIRDKARGDRQTEGHTGYGQRQISKNTKHNMISRAMNYREDYGYEFIWLDGPNKKNKDHSKSWNDFIAGHWKWININDVNDYLLMTENPVKFYNKFKSKVKVVPGWRLINKRVVFHGLGRDEQTVYHTKEESMYYR